MDLVRWMETFVSVASLRSLSEAARGQNLTPSAVSKQLAALEHHLGVTLISRTTRGLSLTSAGQTFLPRAIKIVDEISSALHDARGSSLAPRGMLSVGAPVAFGRLHVGPAIPKFLQQYPDVSINLGLFDRQVDPVLSGIDVSFRMGQLRDSSFVAAKLATTRRVLCASPDYLAKRGRPKSPEDLAQHDCLVHTVYTARNVWYFRRKNELRSVLVKGRLGANNSEALFQATRQGLGIALLGSWAVAEELKSGVLEPLLPGWTGELTREARHLYLVYQRTTQASQLTRAFVDFVRDHFGSPPYWDRQL
jgi:DNA-binding transcriptional LysR family regulator